MTKDVTTPVCQHGWPIYDKDPCPDCLADLETGGIPDFLKRPNDPTRSPGELPRGNFSLSAPAPAVKEKDERGPGSVAKRLGYSEHPADVEFRETYRARQIEAAQVKRANNIAKQKARREEKTSIKGKRWDSRIAKWVKD